MGNIPRRYPAACCGEFHFPFFEYLPIKPLTFCVIIGCYAIIRINNYYWFGCLRGVVGKMSQKVAVIGAQGYVGRGFRLLLVHPNANLAVRNQIKQVELQLVDTEKWLVAHKSKVS